MDVVEDDVLTWLAQKEFWFRQGSNLFKSAAHLKASLDDNEVFDDLLVIGKPAARIVKSHFDGLNFDLHMRQPIPCMLFAMAVECWLKGIIVAKRLAPHRAKLREAEDGRAQIAYQEEVRGWFLDLKRKFAKHNLLALAEAAGMEVTPRLRKDFRFLSAMITIGRYPAHFIAQENMTWDKGQAIDDALWNRVTKAVFALYDSIESHTPQPSN